MQYGGKNFPARTKIAAQTLLCYFLAMNKIAASLLNFLDKISPPARAHAHCDVPCGVYEVDSMKWAVETCAKMVEKLAALESPKDDNHHAMLEYHNTFARGVAVKEEYAQICKEQILILWTDYFKAEHLAKWPNLHELVWKATKQCSAVKRSVSAEEVKKLKEFVEQVAEIFLASKK